MVHIACPRLCTVHSAHKTSIDRGIGDALSPRTMALSHRHHRSRHKPCLHLSRTLPTLHHAYDSSESITNTSPLFPFVFRVEVNPIHALSSDLFLPTTNRPATHRRISASRTARAYSSCIVEAAYISHNLLNHRRGDKSWRMKTIRKLLVRETARSMRWHLLVTRSLTSASPLLADPDPAPQAPPQKKQRGYCKFFTTKNGKDDSPF